MADIQPPPTYTDPVRIDSVSGKGRFDENWLKWFVDLAGIINTAGGTSIGTVTSVGETFTGGLISVSGSPITTSGTLALTVAGTSGGIPYFSGATTWASSGALTANALLIGGGAGNPPSASSATISAGIITATGFAGALNGTVGATTPASGAFTSVNASSSITSQNNIILAATYGLYLDGGGNTYITEASADRIEIVTGGTTRLSILSTGEMVIGSPSAGYGLTISGGATLYANATASDTVNPASGNIIGTGGNWSIRTGTAYDFNIDTYSGGNRNSFKIPAAGGPIIPSGDKFRFDGSTTGDTYIQESSANVLALFAGGTAALQVVASGTITTGHALFGIDNIYTIGAIGSNRPNTLYVSQQVNIAENASAIPTLTDGTEAGMFMRNDNFVIAYNDSGTMKYRYIDLTSTAATWVYSTTSP